jgi:hypothetical protein
MTLKKHYYIGFVVAVNKKENLCTYYYQEPTDLMSDKNWSLKTPTNFHPPSSKLIERIEDFLGKDRHKGSC